MDPRSLSPRSLVSPDSMRKNAWAVSGSIFNDRKAHYLLGGCGGKGGTVYHSLVTVNITTVVNEIATHILTNLLYLLVVFWE